ncbi:hypothetical protein CBL_08757 [Carabus blaptoides fortunei]
MDTAMIKTRLTWFNFNYSKTCGASGQGNCLDRPGEETIRSPYTHVHPVIRRLWSHHLTADVRTSNSLTQYSNESRVCRRGLGPETSCKSAIVRTNRGCGDSARDGDIWRPVTNETC